MLGKEDRFLPCPGCSGHHIPMFLLREQCVLRGEAFAVAEEAVLCHWRPGMEWEVLKQEPESCSFVSVCVLAWVEGGRAGAADSCCWPMSP